MKILKIFFATVSLLSASALFCDELESMMTAASAGEVSAQVKLADYFATGGGGKFTPNYPSAVFWWRKAADQGDVSALTNLGICYYLGNGVDRSVYFSSRYWMKAAKANDSSAQYYLGLSYCNGLGVMKDMTLAAYWWGKSAEGGNIDATNSLAFCYSRGQGVKKNAVEAFKLWTTAAEAGNLIAQCKLAQCYYTGEGVRIDRRKAVAIWTAAAEKGDGESQKFLGVCYYRGEGVAQDKKEAYRWFALSAQKGDKEALAAAEQIRLEMPPGTFSAVKRPEVKSAEQQQAPSQAAQNGDSASLQGLQGYRAMKEAGISAEAPSKPSAKPGPGEAGYIAPVWGQRLSPSMSIPAVSDMQE